MLRKKLFHQHGKTTIRGKEIYRIEALSDAVFAFTVSLLIMSLEVPQTFSELKHIMLQFFPFLATVSLVFFFWYLQNNYFRSYGLNDAKVILLNLCLLVLLLFYVYPLKFLFSLLLGFVLHINYFEQVVTKGETVILQEEFPLLIIFFSLGYAVIWFLFFLLYRYVFARKQKLELSGQELVVLRSKKRDALVQVFLGLLSLLFALLNLPLVSGLCFLMIPLWLFVNAVVERRQIKKVEER
ncbi:MAG: DUF1211 domain-containing protein [Chitinophagaceae bacterium]|nr:DUF1211 domain-containing protein [Chitinophagaceae bacterium]